MKKIFMLFVAILSVLFLLSSCSQGESIEIEGTDLIMFSVQTGKHSDKDKTPWYSWGIKDKNGNILVEPKYEDVLAFEDFILLNENSSVAKASDSTRNYHWYNFNKIINKNGQPFREDLSLISGEVSFTEGQEIKSMLLLRCNDGVYGFLLKERRLVGPYRSLEIDEDYIYPCSPEGYKVATRNGEFLIDKYHQYITKINDIKTGKLFILGSDVNQKTGDYSGHLYTAEGTFLRKLDRNAMKNIVPNYKDEDGYYIKNVKIDNIQKY